MSKKSYWWEAEAFAYYRVPKALFTNPRYKDLSADTALFYGLLLDRTGLSGRNVTNFSDENGCIFIYYTLNKVCTALGCGHDKATRLFVELEKYGLLIRKRQGKGKPNCKSSVQITENPHAPTLKSRIPGCGYIAGNDIYSIKLSSNSLPSEKEDI